MLHTQRLVDAEKQSLEASSSTSLSRYRGMGDIEESAEIEMRQRSYIATTPVGTYTGPSSTTMSKYRGTQARGNTQSPSPRPSLSPQRLRYDAHAGFPCITPECDPPPRRGGGSHSGVMQGNEGTWARGNTRILGPSPEEGFQIPYTISSSPLFRRRTTDDISPFQQSSAVLPDELKMLTDSSDICRNN
jgi:hypothetical protein